MYSPLGASRGSRGARFSQILQRNSPDLPQPTGVQHNTVNKQAEKTGAPKQGMYWAKLNASKVALRARAMECTHEGERGYWNRPHLPPRELMDRYKEGESHPVSTLHQLASVLELSLELKETVTPGNTPGFFFAFCVAVDGVTYPTGTGVTKKEARMRAAQLALRDLLPRLEAKMDSAQPPAGGPPTLPVRDLQTYRQAETHGVLPSPRSSRTLPDQADLQSQQMSQAVQQLLSDLLQNHPELSPCGCTVAAFLLQSPGGCEVVALGTGSVNTASSCTAPNQRVLHDSHAVVVARRSLMRFLYRHLLMFFDRKASLQQESVFQRSAAGPLLAIKSDRTLHLYLNHLPKGAAQMSPNLRLNPLSMAAWEVINQLSLHLVVEGKVFSVSSVEPSAAKMHSMSSTDKLTQWQVLGYQGALLSHLTQPVYAHSVLVGDAACVNPRGVALAVSDRAEGVTGCLPLHYCLVRPRFTLAPPINAAASGRQNLSLNWSQGDRAVEAVDGLLGTTVEESPFKSGPAMASRLCKAAMLSRFNRVAGEAERPDLLSTVSYREAKMKAKCYQEAKNLLKVHLSTKGYGVWPSKPPHSDNFNI